jgi:hypothetical protein
MNTNTMPSIRAKRYARNGGVVPRGFAEDALSAADRAVQEAILNAELQRAIELDDERDRVNCLRAHTRDLAAHGAAGPLKPSGTDICLVMTEAKCR